MPPGMRRAIIRCPSPALADGERTHMDRTPIDMDRAIAQHQAYGAALERAGFAVTTLPALDGFPDCSFVEDTALILPEVAVALHPGAASRVGEVDSIAAVFPTDRPHARIPAPNRIDGGDVLVVKKQIFVGLSARTTADGVASLAEIVLPFGYQVRGILLGAALHLKTAVTALVDDLLLYNPAWIDAAQFEGFRALAIDPAEPFAANILRLPDGIFSQAMHPQTSAIVQRAGFPVEIVDLSELAKAEAGLTCSSLLIEPPSH
jgi:dimethylargininase